MKPIFDAKILHPGINFLTKSSTSFSKFWVHCNDFFSVARFPRLKFLFSIFLHHLYFFATFCIFFETGSTLIFGFIILFNFFCVILRVFGLFLEKNEISADLKKLFCSLIIIHSFITTITSVPLRSFDTA